MLLFAGIGSPATHALAAEPGAKLVPATVEYVNKRGDGSSYPTGDAGCEALELELNAKPGFVHFWNGKFRDKPNYGEGCEFDIYDRDSGNHNGRHHYQRWVFSRMTCPRGYDGVYYSGDGSKPYCRLAAKVVGPPVCPDPVAGPRSAWLRWTRHCERFVSRKRIF
ncbi:hypothetical protein [Lysobacter sp. CA199]|uniref:hypothetical protein n=1 Tax=Lysobacter sp. CA199 TaxID=3455608 RepID=UPI003F8D8C30